MVFWKAIVVQSDFTLVEQMHCKHKLNMEVDLQSLFGLRVPWCAKLYSLAEPRNSPPPPAFGLVFEGAIGQQR